MPINKIKQVFYNSRIRRDRKKLSRTLELKSWDQIRTIGFLYVVPDETEYVRFTDFVGRLQSQKKDVKAMGLLRSKNIPHYCYPRLAFDYISRKSLTWYGIPRGLKISDFLNNEFDLLVNIDMEDNRIFNYIVAASRAHLKAGTCREKYAEIYDLMINVGEFKDYETLLEHIINYLNILRKS